MKAAALENYDSDWGADAIATIIGLSQSQALITADDLRKELRPAPHAGHVGAAFVAARQLGFIEPVGYATSTTKTRNHGVLRTWKRADKGVTK